MDDVANARALAGAAAERTHVVVGMLRHLDRSDLLAASELPGWSRLTIACHLRDGARALLRMTRDALAGRATSYYPAGRATQRPATLLPGPGEDAAALLDDWQAVAIELDHEWSAITDEQRSTAVVEPADDPDLGIVPLARLALARFTEVDVHGTDLAIGCPDWSTTLVSVGLPTRLRWLATRRSNHRDVDTSVHGSWLLRTPEGLRWPVTVDQHVVVSRPATGDDVATAVIEGSGRDVLALLLGRPTRQPLRLDGDIELAAAFGRAFPGP